MHLATASPKKKPPISPPNLSNKVGDRVSMVYRYGSTSVVDHDGSGEEEEDIEAMEHGDSNLQVVQRESIRHSIADWEKMRTTAVSSKPPPPPHGAGNRAPKAGAPKAGARDGRKKTVEWAEHHTEHHVVTHNAPGSPFFNSASRIEEYLKSPVQAEYIDLIKTQFFSLGIASGASLQLFIVSFLLMFASASTEAGPMRELGHEYYPVFRGVLLISFFFSMYGANMFVWRRANVDYSHVLGVSYAHTYQYVLRGSSSTAYITFSMFMLYFLEITGNSDFTDRLNSGSWMRHIWPALSIALPLLLFLVPFDQWTILCYGVQRNGFKQRLGLIKEIAQVLVSPFSEVTFMRSFIADIFCSMPRIFTDLQYTVCIYATGAAFSRSPDDLGPYDLKPHAYYTCGAGNKRYYALNIMLGFCPYLIRLMQSCRAYRDTRQSKHVWNAFKYCLSLCVTGLAFAHTAAASNHWPPVEVTVGFPPWTPVLTTFTVTDPAAALDTAWICVGITATLYSFYWDVVMDWGLGHLDSIHWGLRDDLCFHPDRYYAAIALDFVLRLGWAFVISPDQRYVAENYMLLLGAVELMRRSMWAIFRVEWESIHLKTTKKDREKVPPSSRSAAAPSVPLPAIALTNVARRHSEYSQHHFAAGYAPVHTHNSPHSTHSPHDQSTTASAARSDSDSDSTPRLHGTTVIPFA